LDNQLRLRFCWRLTVVQWRKGSHGSDGEFHGGAEECTVGAA